MEGLHRYSRDRQQPICDSIRGELRGKPDKHFNAVKSKSGVNTKALPDLLIFQVFPLANPMPKMRLVSIIKCKYYRYKYGAHSFEGPGEIRTLRGEIKAKRRFEVCRLATSLVGWKDHPDKTRC